MLAYFSIPEFLPTTSFAIWNLGLVAAGVMFMSGGMHMVKATRTPGPPWYSGPFTRDADIKYRMREALVTCLVGAALTLLGVWVFYLIALAAILGALLTVWSLFKFARWTAGLSIHFIKHLPESVRIAFPKNSR